LMRKKITLENIALREFLLTRKMLFKKTNLQD
jgi:hypothetical protein